MHTSHSPTKSPPASTGSRPSKKPVGRPRDARAHAAILQATRELLCTHGYAGITIERIARQAKVGRPTIYRRWDHLGLLVYEAVFADFHFGAWSDSGSLDTDLKVFLEGVVSELRRPEATEAIAGLLVEMGANPQLQELLFERWLRPLADRFIILIERAALRGEIKAQIAPEIILDALVGTAFFRALMLRMELGVHEREQLVTVLSHGLRHAALAGQEGDGHV